MLKDYAQKRKLFDKYRELEYYLTSPQKEYFKSLVHKLVRKLPLKLSASEDLQSIAEDFNMKSDVPNWKKRLIKEPDLLDNRAYIVISDDNKNCWLLKSEKPHNDDGYQLIK